MADLKKKMVTIHRHKVLGALVGLVHACENRVDNAHTTGIIVESLALLTEPVDDGYIARLQSQCEKIHEEKECVSISGIYCTSRYDNTKDYDIDRIWDAAEDLRAAKLLMLQALYATAVRLDRKLADEDSKRKQDMEHFLYIGLSILSNDCTTEQFMKEFWQAWREIARPFFYD